MNKQIKSFVIYLVCSLPIMLLTKLALSEGHLTMKNTAITLAEALINAIVITGVINWIGRQQPKKA